MPIPSNLETDLDLFVRRAMEAWTIPGIAVAIVKDDRTIVSKGYGLRDNQKPDLVDEHTLFAIASNTKAFTATALGLLVQEGKLKWDDLVTDILPWFHLYDEHATHLITIRDLLCHRSGLGTWAGDMLQLSTYSVEEVVRRVRHVPPAYAFRAGYGYSNLMFLTAGLVLTTVSGLSWDDFIQQRLLDPIGMTDTLTSPRFFGERTNIAAPHEEIEGEVRTVPYRAEGGFSAAGDIMSCVQDLALWLRLQLKDGCLDDHQLIDPAIIRETHTPQTIMPFQPPPAEQRIFASTHFAAYGLGWFLNDLHGRLLVRHTGGLDGMLSSVAMVPEENFGIAVLTNKLPNLGYLAITYHLIDRLLSIEERDWLQAYLSIQAARKQQAEEAKEHIRAAHAQGTQTSLPIQAFTGEYEAPIIGGATLLEQDGLLRIQLHAHPNLGGTLTHWHYDSFMCKWDDPVLGESLIPFMTDGQGRVREFGVKIREDWIDPVEHRFRKIENH